MRHCCANLCDCFTHATSALEGADLTLTYLPKEKEDAQEAVQEIKKKTNNARKIQLLELDLRKEEACKQLVEKHLKFHGKLDSLYVINPSMALTTTESIP